MTRSVFSPAYAALKRTLVEMREAAGLTQRALAERLRRERSFVARLESGQRRVDIVEFYWICTACNADPNREFQKLFKLIRSSGKEGRP